MLVRFCILRRDPDSHKPMGIFQAAFEVRNSDLLEPYEEDWLERELSWLRMHLPSPDCLGEEGNQRAICWFRTEAWPAIDKVRSIAALLQTKGIHVEMVKTSDPGTILYSDNYQVVAKPRRGRGG